MNGRRLLVALSAAVLTIGLASSAAAQTRPLPRKGQEAPAKPAADKKPAPKRVLRLEEMRVEGRVQKPQALFLMPRANVSSGEQDRTESFLPKAKDALQKEPF